MIELQTKIDLIADHKIEEYYAGATAEYKTWSRDYYMHFGPWRWGLNPFKRQDMLEEMNERVLDQMPLKNGPARVADLGCGVGSVTAYAARKYPAAHFVGITLVDEQVRFAKMIHGRGLDIRCGDYHDLPFMNETLDGAFFLESFCHSEHPAQLLDEVARCIKPGGKFVLVDGFITRPVARLKRLERKCHDVVATNFALPGFPVLPHTVALLKGLGFTDIKVKDMSMQIAPCAMHAPGLTILAWLKKVLKGERMTKVQIQHFKACFASLFLGMTPSFKYCMITATRK
jgi:MPBQ/MSBQ methyltransferase